MVSPESQALFLVPHSTPNPFISPPTSQRAGLCLSPVQMKKQKQREIGDLCKATPLTGDDGGREAQHCGPGVGDLIIPIAPFGRVRSGKEGSGM